MSFHPYAKPVIIVSGPSGSQKSDTAAQLAMLANGSVINGDAFQCYKGLEILTNQPTATQRQVAPHVGYGLVSPQITRSVQDFLTETYASIADCHNEDRLPIITGGSGMYLHTLVYGLSQTPEASCREHRLELEARADKNGSHELYGELARVDPEYAGRIHRNDRKRIIRALEVYRATGKPFSAGHSNIVGDPRLRFFWIALWRTPNEEYTIDIRSRTANMIQRGLKTELENIGAAGAVGQTACAAIGLTAGLKWVQREMSDEEFCQSVAFDTRLYARKQLKYLKRVAGIFPVPADQSFKAIEAVHQFLS